MSYSEFDQEHDLDEGEERKAPPAPFWSVAIYLCDRAFGGPEEGGWYYDCGERVDHALEGVPDMCIFTLWSTPEAACAASLDLQKLLDATVNVGRRDISSVLSTGRYVSQVYNGHPPHHFPETRPRYE